MDAPQTLFIDGECHREIVRHLSAALPCEGCGLLGASDEDGYWRAEAFYPGQNIDASPARFTMDPREVIAAFADMERRGWRIGAIVHSHPRTQATLSRTDLHEAAYPEALLVVVSFASTPPEIRAWLLAGAGESGPREVPIVVSERPPPSGQR